MQYRGSDFMHFSTMPVFNRISIKPVKIFVVPIHEQRRKWFFFQPVEQMFFFFIFFFKTPYSAKIPTDNHIILFGHSFLFRKILSIKSPVFTMTISCNIYHLKHFLSNHVDGVLLIIDG